MSFIPNEAGIRALFHTEDGPVGRFVARKAVAVTQRAHANASGRPGPDIRTGDLQVHLRFAGVFQTQSGMRALVGSDAAHRGYNYPFALETGRDPNTGQPTRHARYPFLMPAIRSEFPGFS